MIYFLFTLGPINAIYEQFTWCSSVIRTRFRSIFSRKAALLLHGNDTMSAYVPCMFTPFKMPFKSGTGWLSCFIYAANWWKPCLTRQQNSISNLTRMIPPSRRSPALQPSYFQLKETEKSISQFGALQVPLRKRPERNADSTRGADSTAWKRKRTRRFSNADLPKREPTLRSRRLW